MPRPPDLLSPIGKQLVGDHLQPNAAMLGPRPFARNMGGNRRLAHFLFHWQRQPHLQAPLKAQGEAEVHLAGRPFKIKH